MKTTKCAGGYIYDIPKADIERLKYIEGINHNEDIKDAYERVTRLYGRAPDLFMNCELFDFITRRPASDVVCDGKVHRLTQSYGIAFKNYKEPVFSYNNNVNAPDYVGGYPTLIRNSKKETSEPSGITGVRGRIALGVSKDSFYVTLIPDNKGVSLSKLRTSLLSADATDAINLDGGGSAQYYSPNGKYYTGRKVRGFVAVYLKAPASEATPTTTHTTTQPVKEDIRTVTALLPLRIRQEPTTQSKIMGWLYRGNKVKVLSEANGWCRINKGYVSSTYLKK